MFFFDFAMEKKNTPLVLELVNASGIMDKKLCTPFSLFLCILMFWVAMLEFANPSAFAEETILDDVQSFTS